VHNVKTGSGAHRSSYPLDTGVLSLGIKRPGREADHLPSPNTEVRNVWCIDSLPNTPPWVVAWLFGWFIPVAPTVEHRASVKRFVSLKFLNLRYSVGLLG
jgi:hypothetical protein